MDGVKQVTASVSSDEDQLMSLGVKPELKRTYTFWSCKTTIDHPSYDKAELDLCSNGISDYYSLFLELQYCHVLLHIHSGRACLFGLGNVSLRLPSLRQRRLLTQPNLTVLWLHWDSSWSWHP